MRQILKELTFTVGRQAQRIDEMERLNQASLQMSACNTDHGVAVHNSLTVTSNVKVSLDGSGSSIIDDDLIEKVPFIYNQYPRSHEQHLVSLYAPILIEILAEVNPDLRLVNSESESETRLAFGTPSSCSLLPTLQQCSNLCCKTIVWEVRWMGKSFKHLLPLGCKVENQHGGIR